MESMLDQKHNANDSKIKAVKEQCSYHGWNKKNVSAAKYLYQSHNMYLFDSPCFSETHYDCKRR